MTFHDAVHQHLGMDSWDMSSTPPTEAEHAIYLLGIAPESLTATRAEIQSGYGMLEYHSAFDLDAWLVHVPREEFTGPTAEQNLADLNWLSPRVMAHQLAVQHLAEHVPLLPMRFGTLFTGELALREFLRRNLATLTSFLAEEGRHVEWGIKCYVDWTLAAGAFQHMGTTDRAESVAVGMNYLLKKKLIRDRDRALQPWLTCQLQRLRSLVAAETLRICDRDLLKEASSSQRECVANWAVLRGREQHAGLQELVDHIRLQVESSGLTLEVTGPWPPYSFVPSLDEVPWQKAA